MDLCGFERVENFRLGEHCFHKSEGWRWVLRATALPAYLASWCKRLGCRPGSRCESSAAGELTARSRRRQRRALSRRTGAGIAWSLFVIERESWGGSLSPNYARVCLLYAQQVPERQAACRLWPTSGRGRADPISGPVASGHARVSGAADLGALALSQVPQNNQRQKNQGQRPCHGACHCFLSDI